jgi:hypothetical protein
MDSIRTNKFVYVKRYRRSRSADLMQLAIISGFLLIAILASLWLPIYFGGLALHNF